MCWADLLLWVINPVKGINNGFPPHWKKLKQGTDGTGEVSLAHPGPAIPSQHRQCAQWDPHHALLWSRVSFNVTGCHGHQCHP